MIRPYGEVDDEQDPYKGFSDSNHDTADTPPQSNGLVRNTDEPTVERARPSAPEPYAPPSTVKPEGADEPQPRRTFAQMEAEGQARPPAPNYRTVTDALPNVTDGTDPRPQITSIIPEELPNITDLLPPPPPEHYGYTPPTPPSAPPLPPPSIEPSNPVYTPPETPGEQAPPPPPLPRSGGDPTVGAPPINSSILELLTGKSQGTDKSPLAAATEAKTLAQLGSSSPYDSKAVRDEYDFLGGNIDDQFANDTRMLDNEMARKGLYGSAGKDFHSGRASDLNVGKRSAKTALAQDLATKYATSKGQYDANAISQAQTGTQQETGNQMDWLRTLMGYGNDAFNHDLASAEFGQRQNESEQDFLMRMLQMGYGV